MKAKNQTTPWNNGKLTGKRAPLRFHEIYAIRIRLELAQRSRDLASLMPP